MKLHHERNARSYRVETEDEELDWWTRFYASQTDGKDEGERLHDPNVPKIKVRGFIIVVDRLFSDGDN